MKTNRILLSIAILVGFFTGMAEAGEKVIPYSDLDVSVWKLRNNVSGTSDGGARNLIDPDKTDQYPSMPIVRNDPYDPSTWTGDSGSSWQTDFQGPEIDAFAALTDDPWFVFDLGSNRNLAKMIIWNVAEASGWGRGIETFNLYYSTSPTVPVTWWAKSGTLPGTATEYDFQAGGWTQFGTTFTVDRGAGGTTAKNEIDLAVDFAGAVSARYIGIEIKTNLGDGVGRAGLNTVVFTEVDDTLPTLATSDITNNVGSTLEEYNPVTYTLTFSEEMRPESVTSGVFSAGIPISVDSVSPDTATNVFEVVVVPQAQGSLTLQVSSNVLDVGGNTLAANVTDDETITVGADSTAPNASVTNSLSSPVTTVGSTVRYTFDFNEHMNTNTFAAGDFSNLSNAAFTVDSIGVGADPSIIIVDVIPTEIGYLDLQLDSGSVDDMSANSTAQAFGDGVTIEVLDPGIMIEEHFSQTSGGYVGSTTGSGTGLSGDWAGSGWVVTSNSLEYGDLPVSGNRIVTDGVGDLYAYAVIDPSIAGPLLANGSTIWLSFTFEAAVIGGNPNLLFSFGETRISSMYYSRLANNEDTSTAVGFGIQTENAIAGTYDNTFASGTGSGSLTVDVTTFYVAKITWGVDDEAYDVMELYQPSSSDLTIPGSVVSTASNVFDQSSFDTICMGSRQSTGVQADEIRFGTSYADVSPRPPPSGTVIIFR